MVEKQDSDEHDTKLIMRPVEAQHPNESDTRLTAWQDVLQDWYVEKENVKKLTAERDAVVAQLRDEQNKVDQLTQGGYRKMAKSSIIGVALVAGGIWTLSNRLTDLKASYEIQERDERIAQLNEDAKNAEDRIFSDVEDRQFNLLSDKLDSQVEGANEYFKTIEKTSDGLAGYVASAKSYIENSTPRGELEESVAKEVETLNRFFDSYISNQEGTQAAIAKCYDLSDQAIVRSKSKAKVQVSELNDQYLSTLDAVEQDAQDSISHLEAFRDYVQRSPLRQKDAMVEATNQEIAKLEGISAQVSTYKAVFVENTKSAAIIPVAVGPDPAQVTLVDGYLANSNSEGTAK